MLHHHSTRIASQALRRFCRNARAIFDDGLAGLIGVLQDRGVDMDHHLVVLGRRARIDAVVKRGLGQQLQRVGLLLRHRRRLRGDVGGLTIHAPSVLPLVQSLTGRRQGLHEECPGLGRQATPDGHGAVFAWIHVEGPAGVLPGGLVSLHLAIHAAPAAHDALDVLGGAGPPDGEQALFGCRCRHPREGADLGVGEFAARERLGQAGQRRQGARHAHLLSGGAEVETDTPGEPLGARAKAVVPAGARVELADEIQQAGGGGIEVGGEVGDLVPQAVQVGGRNGGAWPSMASPPSIKATLHRGFGATWEAGQCAIAW